jgi:putative transposase
MSSPVRCREDWLAWVNEPQTDKEMEELRASVIRGRPFDSPAWQARCATMLGLESTFRRRGRQRKERVD